MEALLEGIVYLLATFLGTMAKAMTPTKRRYARLRPIGPLVPRRHPPLRQMKSTKRRYGRLRPIGPLFPCRHPPLRLRNCDPPVEPHVTSAAPHPGLLGTASRDKESEASQRTTPPANAPVGACPPVPVEAGPTGVDDPFQAWRESWHKNQTRHESAQ
jgi:hypothetical protein